MRELLSNFWFLFFAWLAVTSVAATLAQAWQKVRRADREAALTEEMLRRGLTVEEMERLLASRAKPHEKPATEPGDDEIIEQMAEALGECGVSAAVLEEVLAALRGADSATRQTTCRAVQAVIRGSEEPAKDTLILAVVRGLCRPAPAEPAREAEPARAPRTDEAVQLGKPA